MGCGATKLQSHVTLPNYHGNVKSSDDTCSVKQNIDSHSLTVNDQDEILVDQPENPIVEVTDNDDRQEQLINGKLEEQEGYRSIENAEKSQVVDKQHNVNKQEAICKQDTHSVASVDKLQGEVTMKCDRLDEAIPEQQTLDKQDTINQHFSSNETSKVHDDSIIVDDIKENMNDLPVAVSSVVNIQTCQYNNSETLSLSCNDLLTSPQQCCNIAKSLSQSPRIVSLQVELGFVNVTHAELDMLHSKSTDL